MGTTTRVQTIDSEGRNWEVTGILGFMLKMKKVPAPGDTKRIEIASELGRLVREMDYRYPWRNKGRCEYACLIEWEFRFNNSVPGVTCWIKIKPQSRLLRGQVLAYQKYLEALAKAITHLVEFDEVCSGLRLEIEANAYLGHFVF